MRDSEEENESMSDDLSEEDKIEDISKPKDHDFHLYTLLGIERNATENEIKKAYRKTSLKVHPDKNPNDPDADKKFQKVNEAYVILSDDKKRKHYDLTGEVDQENLEDLVNRCRFFYKEFTADDIDDFATRYKNSGEEEEDLVNFYETYKGDITNILEFIPLSENNDIPRYVKIFDTLIKEKQIKAFKRYKETKNNIKLISTLEEEESEAINLQDQVKGRKRDKKQKSKHKNEDNSFQELQNKILAKRSQANTGNFLDALANKYCDPGEEIGGMPDEEAFQKARKNMKSSKKAATKKVGKAKKKK